VIGELFFMDVDSYILGESFTRFREEKGLTQAYLAHQLCCSKLQVQEIEEGGATSFYSQTQKLIAAKKMARFLGMGDEQAFVGMPPSIDSKIDVHQYLGVDRKSFKKSSPVWSFVGVSAVILLLLVYGLWGTFSSEIHLFADQWIKQKDIKSRVETEAFSRSEDNAPLPESSLGQEGFTQKANEPNQVISTQTNVFGSNQAPSSVKPIESNTDYQALDTKSVSLPSAIKTTPKIDNTASAE
jgi:cytoskeletal protein RodZ